MIGWALLANHSALPLWKLPNQQDNAKGGKRNTEVQLVAM